MQNLLDIDLKDFVSPIKEAFSKTFGEKYTDINNERIDKGIYINYNNIKGMEFYAEYLIKCKRDELILKIFTKMGLNISKYQSNELREIHNYDFTKLIRLYFLNNNPFEYSTIPCGILAFNENIKGYDANFIRDVQIDFLNDLCFNGRKIINVSNYDEFQKSDVYKRFYSSVPEWLNYLEELKKEYNEYKEKYVIPYNDYVDTQNSRLDYIHEENIIAIYMNIESKLPKKVFDILTNKYSFQIDRAFILGNVDDSFGFQYFSEYANRTISLGTYDEKIKIMKLRLEYFRNLGLIDFEDSLKNENVFKLYEQIMQKSDIAASGPTPELVTYLASLKKDLIINSISSLILLDNNFCNSMDRNNVSQASSIYFSKRLVDNTTCVTTAETNNVFVTLLFFTIREHEGGLLDSILVHELLHLIHTMAKSLDFTISGFDLLYSIFENGVRVADKSPKNRNPYDDNYRLYERFNEIIEDLLCEKVVHVLHEEMDVYLLEDKSIARKNINYNTNNILRNILRPFVDKYFDILIEALENCNLDTLFTLIGKENYDKLVNIVNYIDNLVNAKNLSGEIKNQEYDALTYKKYLYQIDQVINLYDEMDKYAQKQTINLKK